MAQRISMNRRRNYRRPIPQLAVTLKGLGDTRYTKDWSLGGIALIGPVEGLEVGSQVEGEIGRCHDNAQMLPFTAQVVRTEQDEDDNVMVAFEFTDISAECFSFLERLLRRPFS
jgi:hypothetical protein